MGLIIATGWEPEGIRYDEVTEGRWQRRLLVTCGSLEGWICYRHSDGQWVTLRAASEDERARIIMACNDARLSLPPPD